MSTKKDPAPSNNPMNMDTSKLQAEETYTTGDAHTPAISFQIGTDADYQVTVSAESDEKDGNILEIATEVRDRWNAYPYLIAQRDKMIAALKAAEDFLMDGTPQSDISPLEASTRTIIREAIANAEGKP